MSVNVLELARARVEMKEISRGARGREYWGPCPGCGGRDRFHVWPEQNDGVGSYWCRGCECRGDNIQFFRDFDGLGYRDACAAAGQEPGAYKPQPLRRPAESRPVSGVKGARGFLADDPVKWVEHVSKYVKQWAEDLKNNPAAQEYLASRGIPVPAQAAYGLGINHEVMYRPRESYGLSTILKKNGRKKMLWIPRGIVIPYSRNPKFPAETMEVCRVRIRRPTSDLKTDKDSRFCVIQGSDLRVAAWGSKSSKVWIVVEAELDAMAIRWAVRGMGVGVCSVLTNLGKPHAELHEVFQGAMKILVALDNDGPGAEGWPWWQRTYPQAVRWPVPKGKDPGDYVKDHGGDLRAWVWAGLPPVMKISRFTPVHQAATSTSASAPASPSVEKEKPSLQVPEDVFKLHSLMARHTGCRVQCVPGRYGPVLNAQAGLVAKDTMLVGGVKTPVKVFSTFLDLVSSPAVQEWCELYAHGESIGPDELLAEVR